MKPYYQDSAVTIYHGDNRRIAPQLGEFDLLLTDPPYGIGEDGGAARTRGSQQTNGPKMGWDKETPTAEIFQLMLSHSLNRIIWGGNYFTDKLPVSRGWLYWHKFMGGDFSDGELAWTSFDRPLKAFLFCDKGRVRLHPTEKPESLMLWCLSHAPEAKTVLDPWMGSGTTLVAAKLRGLKATGIEINESYCESAAHRLSQEVLAL